MREKYKRDGVFKQQVFFVIPEIHNELSGIHIAGDTLVRQRTNKNPHECGAIISMNLVSESYHTYRVFLHIHFLIFV